MSGGLEGPALAVPVVLAAGVPQHLVGRPLADGEDECVRYGSDELTVPVTVVVN